MRFPGPANIKRRINRFFYRYTLRNITHRNELPHILNRRSLLGEGAEIGVHRGYFSNIILKNWNGRKLYSVDPWKTFTDIVSEKRLNREVDALEENFSVTVEKLGVYGTRSSILKLTSFEASKVFGDNQLDFVYIDAQHNFEAINNDIYLWYPKVSSGGILCGHDYVDGIINNINFGVKSAVNQFVAKNDLTFYLSKEPFYPSWFIVKP